MRRLEPLFTSRGGDRGLGVETASPVTACAWPCRLRSRLGPLFRRRLLAGGRALHQLILRDIFHVCGDGPNMPERILDGARAVAVELIRHFLLDLCARVDRALELP